MKLQSWCSVRLKKLASSAQIITEEGGLTRGEWRRKARFFHDEDTRYLRFLVLPGLRILELGCGAGHTLAALAPAEAVGVDRSKEFIHEGREIFPSLQLHIGDIEDEETLARITGKFDVILLVDTLGSLRDCQTLLVKLHRFCTRRTRVLLIYYSHLWEPLLKLAEALGWKRREGAKNVFSPADIAALAELTDFDPFKSERRLLSPLRLFGVGRFLNRFLAPLPLIRRFNLRQYVVCRSIRSLDETPLSATVVIPARNERGNIEPTIRRLPSFCDDLEVIFVEGHSADGTLEEIKRVQAAYPERDIKVISQPGDGKADAVFAGFEAARGDVLMILDGDLTVAPEELPKFWEAIHTGRGEFINASRLVYPMERGAMRLFNLVGNRLFSTLFSWILSQRYTDTLCGIKALRRKDYIRIKTGRAFFGNFDPFGDFDLIFGAAKLNLRTVEIPVRYTARGYGETKISRFRHGLLLLKMVAFAFLKVKAI